MFPFIWYAKYIRMKSKNHTASKDIGMFYYAEIFKVIPIFLILLIMVKIYLYLYNNLIRQKS